MARNGAPGKPGGPQLGPDCHTQYEGFPACAYPTSGMISAYSISLNPMLSNSQLRFFDAEVLRLPQDKRTEYHQQVDRLIKTLSAAVKDKTKIKITRVVRSE